MRPILSLLFINHFGPLLLLLLLLLPLPLIHLPLLPLLLLLLLLLLLPLLSLPLHLNFRRPPRLSSLLHLRESLLPPSLTLLLGFSCPRSSSSFSSYPHYLCSCFCSSPSSLSSPYQSSSLSSSYVSSSLSSPYQSSSSLSSSY